MPDLRHLAGPPCCSRVVAPRRSPVVVRADLSNAASSVKPPKVRPCLAGLQLAWFWKLLFTAWEGHAGLWASPQRHSTGLMCMSLPVIHGADPPMLTVACAGRDAAAHQACCASLQRWLCGECGAAQQPRGHGELAPRLPIAPCCCCCRYLQAAKQCNRCPSEHLLQGGSLSESADSILCISALPACLLARCPPSTKERRPSSPPPQPLLLQIGFFALLLVELVAGQGLLDLLGFTTGNGLGFEL